MASQSEPLPERELDSVRMTLLVWAGAALAYLAAVLVLGQEPYDGDDLMRLQQVRDLMAGQGWFDVTQYRMNPPTGVAMHWSRLVDLPLVAVMIVLRIVLPQALAESWAAMLVPLFYLGAALLLLRAIMLRLGFVGWQVLAGLGLAALFPLVPAAFAPMRIDHHSPQAVAALAMAALMLRAPSRQAALLGGLVGAVWLVISLEGLPVIAFVAGLYGLRYALVRDRSLAWFLGALALAAPLLSLATRPMSEFALWCDVLLPAHWAAFAAAAVAAGALSYLPRQDRLVGRVLAMGLLPLLSAPVAMAMIGPCLSGPLAALDPLVRSYWYNHVYEGLPIWMQPPSLALPALYTLALVTAGLWAARREGLLRDEARLKWLLHALLALGVACYGLLLLREILVAQLLAVPFALALLIRFMPRARALTATIPRVLATMACVLLVTPAGAAIAGKQIGQRSLPSDHFASQPRQHAAGLAPCDFADLQRLGEGYVFTSFNSAPEILAHTSLGVTTGGYHRNVEALHRVISAFIADTGEARAIVKQSGANYLAICLEDDSLVIFAEDRPESLARALLLGERVDWLDPVSGFENTQLRVYRVR
ncbi:hypothetical protein [Aurantiacibacter flavus]|uniref:Uncharacterized protein n=1 Tax=Aurantiacibacter flavus TaxID=3145232 RepID=A0ABV0CZ57_9SPHN